MHSGRTRYSAAYARQRRERRAMRLSASEPCQPMLIALMRDAVAQRRRATSSASCAMFMARLSAARASA